MVGRNPKIVCIGNKLRLLKTLREFHAKPIPAGSARMPLAEYHPQTFELEDAVSRKAFIAEVAADPKAQWICKPTGLNCGQGIFVVPNAQTFVKELKAEEKARSSGMRRKAARILQRYIPNPLLLKGRKFDIRCYMLIATTKPLTVFYGGPGYCRPVMHTHTHTHTHTYTTLSHGHLCCLARAWEVLRPHVTK